MSLCAVLSQEGNRGGSKGLRWAVGNQLSPKQPLALPQSQLQMLFLFFFLSFLVTSSPYAS